MVDDYFVKFILVEAQEMFSKQ